MRPDLLEHVLALGAMLATTSLCSGCDISCDGGTWDKSYHQVCKANEGSVNLNVPVRYDLPATLPVLAHGNLELSGPGFDIVSSVQGASFFGVNVSVPPMSAPMTYTLPVTTSSDTTQRLYVLAVVMAATETSDTNLNLVSGSIDVSISSQEEFRTSFAMIFEHPTTGERFSLSNGVADISGCRLEAQPYCRGGD